MNLDVDVIAVGDAASLERAAELAARALGAGQLVLHPTETVYGLGGDATESSNRAIARIKGRTAEQPLLLLTPDVDALRAAFPDLGWPATAERLAARFWPGPLTLVLPCRTAPSGLLGAAGGVAARVSPDPVIGAILKHWGRPMTSTSANRHGEPPPRTAAEGMRILEAAPDLAGTVRSVVVLDDGPRGQVSPSTIVSLTMDPPRLVREGPVSRAELESCLPQLE